MLSLLSIKPRHKNCTDPKGLLDLFVRYQQSEDTHVLLIRENTMEAWIYLLFLLAYKIGPEAADLLYDMFSPSRGEHIGDLSELGLNTNIFFWDGNQSLVGQSPEKSIYGRTADQAKQLIESMVKTQTKNNILNMFVSRLESSDPEVQQAILDAELNEMYFSVAYPARKLGIPFPKSPNKASVRETWRSVFAALSEEERHVFCLFLANNRPILTENVMDMFRRCEHVIHRLHDIGLLFSLDEETMIHPHWHRKEVWDDLGVEPDEFTRALADLFSETSVDCVVSPGAQVLASLEAMRHGLPILHEGAMMVMESSAIGVPCLPEIKTSASLTLFERLVSAQREARKKASLTAPLPVGPKLATFAFHRLAEDCMKNVRGLNDAAKAGRSWKALGYLCEATKETPSSASSWIKYLSQSVRMGDLRKVRFVQSEGSKSLETESSRFNLYNKPLTKWLSSLQNDDDHFSFWTALCLNEPAVLPENLDLLRKSLGSRMASGAPMRLKRIWNAEDLQISFLDALDVSVGVTEDGFFRMAYSDEEEVGSDPLRVMDNFSRKMCVWYEVATLEGVDIPPIDHTIVVSKYDVWSQWVRLVRRARDANSFSMRSLFRAAKLLYPYVSSSFQRPTVQVRQDGTIILFWFSGPDLEARIVIDTSGHISGVGLDTHKNIVSKRFLREDQQAWLRDISVFNLDPEMNLREKAVRQFPQGATPREFSFDTRVAAVRKYSIPADPMDVMVFVDLTACSDHEFPYCVVAFDYRGEIKSFTPCYEKLTQPESCSGDIEDVPCDG